MKFSIKDFFSKYVQIRWLRIWSHLLKKSLMENFIFCAVLVFHTEGLKTFCRIIFKLTLFFSLKLKQHFSSNTGHTFSHSESLTAKNAIVKGFEAVGKKVKFIMTVKFNTKATTNIWKKWFGKQIESLKFWNKIVCFMRHSEKVGDRTSGTTRTSGTFRTLWTSKASVTPRTTGSLEPLGPLLSPSGHPGHLHCVKSVQIRTRNNFVFGHSLRSVGRKNFQTGLKLEFI